MCKGSNVFSRPVLIGRGLDLIHYLLTFHYADLRVRERRASGIVFKVSGDHSERDTPLPIPNRVVKPLNADGTAGETLWESRKSPGFVLSPPVMAGSFFWAWQAR